MSIGLKRGIVELANHNPEWEFIACETIGRLKRIFGTVAQDIHHVGSTAIRDIKAMPIIDIVTAVNDFGEVEELTPTLEAEGFLRRHWETDEQMLYAIGDYSRSDGIVTHFIHVVKAGSPDWHNYINFRDYLNANLSVAKKYEALKIKLAAENPLDKGREKYLAGKHDFIVQTLRDAQIWACLHDIPKYEAFTEIEPLNKGWSSDKKYYIETTDGQRLLLRVADIAEYDRKRGEYDMLKRVTELDVIASRPIDFGVCDNGKSVYQLLAWVDGKDAESVLPTLIETEQYTLGLKAGGILRKMHTIPAPGDLEDWGVRFGRKVQSRIDFYNSHPIQSKNADIIVRYLQDNQRLLSGRPQTFNHGDYNVTNMIVTPDGNIGAIDFNYYNSDHGDPWWEFDPASWGNEPNAFFITGEFHGYFGGQPPHEFFIMRAYYSAYDALAALCDTSVGEQGKPEEGKRHVENTLRWFDNMRTTVPTWYFREV